MKERGADDLAGRLSRGIAAAFGDVSAESAAGTNAADSAGERQHPPDRGSSLVKRSVVHANTVALLIDQPRLPERVVQELNDFLADLLHHDVPAPIVNALGSLKLGLGMVPLVAWAREGVLAAAHRARR